MRDLVSAIGITGGNAGEGVSTSEEGSGEGASAGAGAGGGPSEVAYWKARFDEVSAIRQSAPEKELAVFREHAAERDRTAQRYIEHLK